MRKKFFIILLFINLIPIISLGLMFISMFVAYGIVTYIISCIYSFYIEYNVFVIDSIILLIYSLYIVKYYYKKINKLLIIVALNAFNFLIDFFIIDTFNILMSV